jgi:putative salt-induced outer membrane protein
MNKTLLASALLCLFPVAAHAEDGTWSGAGELGFALSRGNTKSENLNAKLQFKKEDDQWKHNVYLNAQRSKGEVNSTTVVDGVVVSNDAYQLTANRFETGVSSGYKLDERSYIVGAARYENDDFSPYSYQWIVSLGYGYTAIKNERTELSFEAGPGYRRLDRREFLDTSGTPPVQTLVDPAADGQIVGRGLIAFKHKLTDNTAFENTVLVEAGSNNTFLQNDAGLAVSMNSKLALKLGYQVRHNTDISPGSDKTDQLLTTNLVYNF